MIAGDAEHRERKREEETDCERGTKNRIEWEANGWGWRPNENIHGRQIRKATITAHKHTLINVLHFRFCLYMIELNINWTCMYLHKRRYAPSHSYESECIFISSWDSHIFNDVSGQTFAECILCIFLIYLLLILLMLLNAVYAITLENGRNGQNISIEYCRAMP